MSPCFSLMSSASSECFLCIPFMLHWIIVKLFLLSGVFWVGCVCVMES